MRYQPDIFLFQTKKPFGWLFWSFVNICLLLFCCLIDRILIISIFIHKIYFIELTLLILFCNNIYHLHGFSEGGISTISRKSWQDSDKWCNDQNKYLVINHESICENAHDEHTSLLYWTGYRRYWYNASNVTRGIIKFQIYLKSVIFYTI